MYSQATVSELSFASGAPLGLGLLKRWLREPLGAWLALSGLSVLVCRVSPPLLLSFFLLFFLFFCLFFPVSLSPFCFFCFVFCLFVPDPFLSFFVWRVGCPPPLFLLLPCSLFPLLSFLFCSPFPLLLFFFVLFVASLPFSSPSPFSPPVSPPPLLSFLRPRFSFLPSPRASPPLCSLSSPLSPLPFPFFPFPSPSSLSPLPSLRSPLPFALFPFPLLSCPPGK